MKSIFVKEQLILLDDTIYEQVKGFSWYITDTGYAARTERTLGGQNHYYLHHFVLPKHESLDVDHINRNKLDNQKANLRYIEHWLNSHNRAPQSNSPLGHKGISWSKVQRQWHAYIWVNKKRIHLGYHSEYDDALKVRKEAELKYISINI